MKKNLLLCMALWACLHAHAQKKVWLQEINQDVWQPFIEAYQNTDVQKYLNLHTKDLIRVSAGQRQTKNLTTYSKETGKWFADLKSKNQKIGINFRFLERFVNGESASERGIYEFSYLNEKGEHQFSYGKFHVFLRKVKGKWKIAVDYDSDENQSINAETFKNAFAMDEWEKY